MSTHTDELRHDATISRSHDGIMSFSCTHPDCADKTWKDFVEAVFGKTIVRLAALPPMEYDRVRRQKARQLGVRVGTLDAEVHKARTSLNAGAPS